MLTIKAAVFRYKIETVVLILPVATMIAFAQLRASLPNAPEGFGKPSTIQSVTFGADDNVLPQGTKLGQSTSLRPLKNEKVWLILYDEQMPSVHYQPMCV